MKKYLWIAASLLVFAAIAPVARADEDLEKWDASLKQREQSLRLQEKSVELDRKAAKLEQRRKDIKEGRWMDEESKGGDRHARGQDRCGRGRGGWSRGCPFARWGGLLAYLAVIHLLLSVIVYRDIRTAVPPMSGVWVVVVLMGGLPATVAYGIFRLVMIKSSGK